MGLLGYIAGGALQGAGAGLVRDAQARRDDALELMRQRYQEGRDQAAINAQNARDDKQRGWQQEDAEAAAQNDLIKLGYKSQSDAEAARTAHGYKLDEIAAEASGRTVTVRNSDGSETVISPNGGAGSDGHIGDPTGNGGARRVMGWTPRARDGGDNSDAAVDAKIAALAKAVGVDPDQHLTREEANRVIAAIPATEGGARDLPMRNNNPAAIKDGAFAKSQPGYAGSQGGYAVFRTAQDGMSAAQTLGGRFYARGQRSIRDIIEGRPQGNVALGRADATGGDRDDRGGARVIYTSEGGRSGYTPLTADEKKQLGLSANVAYQRSPSGEISAISGQDTKTAQAQAVPPSAQKAILENHSALRQVDQAIAAVKDRKESFGFGTGALGSTFLNWNDPDGRSARAAVQAIGAKTLHDLSGAAVTASEAPRFEPFIPNLSKDSADTILDKLERFRSQLAGDQADLRSAYSPENGYRGINLPGEDGGSVKTVSNQQQYAALATGARYRDPQGNIRVKR